MLKIVSIIMSLTEGAGIKGGGNRYFNRPFPSSPQPPFQSEAKCDVFVMKISFHSY